MTTPDAAHSPDQRIPPGLLLSGYRPDAVVRVPSGPRTARDTPGLTGRRPSRVGEYLPRYSPPDAKRCIECGVMKPPGDFYRVRRDRETLQSRCKHCDNTTRNRYFVGTAYCSRCDREGHTKGSAKCPRRPFVLRGATA